MHYYTAPFYATFGFRRSAASSPTRPHAPQHAHVTRRMMSTIPATAKSTSEYSPRPSVGVGDDAGGVTNVQPETSSHAAWRWMYSCTVQLWHG